MIHQIIININKSNRCWAITSTYTLPHYSLLFQYSSTPIITISHLLFFAHFILSYCFSQDHLGHLFSSIKVIRFAFRFAFDFFLPFYWFHLLHWVIFVNLIFLFRFCKEIVVDSWFDFLIQQKLSSILLVLGKCHLLMENVI